MKTKVKIVKNSPLLGDCATFSLNGFEFTVEGMGTDNWSADGRWTKRQDGEGFDYNHANFDSSHFKKFDWTQNAIEKVTKILSESKTTEDTWNGEIVEIDL